MATSGIRSIVLEEKQSVARAESCISKSSLLARTVKLCRAIFLDCSFCLVVARHTTAVAASIILPNTNCRELTVQLKHKMQTDILERSHDFLREAEDGEEQLVHECLIRGLRGAFGWMLFVAKVRTRSAGLDTLLHSLVLTRLSLFLHRIHVQRVLAHLFRSSGVISLGFRVLNQGFNFS